MTGLASKTTPTWFRPEVAEYVFARATQPDPVLSRLIERTRAETGGAAGMQVSASQGALLTLLARVGARRGLEIAYAEQAGVRWFILSAQHGPVSPDEVLEPYELRLSKTSGGSVALFDRGPPQGERSGRSGMSDRVPEFVECGGQPEHRFGVDRELVLVAA